MRGRAPSGQIRHACGDQQPGCERLLLLPQRQAERQHVVQQPQRGRQGEAAAEAGRLPRRRADRPARIRRPQQGLLLHELRAGHAAERHDAEQSHRAEHRGHERRFQLCGERRDPDGQRAAARGAQRPALDARSNDVEDAAGDSLRRDVDRIAQRSSIRTSSASRSTSRWRASATIRRSGSITT